MCENYDTPDTHRPSHGVVPVCSLWFALLSLPLIGSGAAAMASAEAAPQLRISLHSEPASAEPTAPRLRSASRPEGALLLPDDSLDLSNPNGAMALFAVRNRFNEPHTVRLQYFAAATPPNGTPVLTKIEHLAPSQISTANLRFVGDLPTSGYIVATAVDPDTLAPLEDASWLTGDYFRLDPTNDFASGDVLVGFSDGPDANARPDGLCNRWDHRFFGTATFDGATDFVFFVLENQTGGERPVVTGDLYDEAGQFIVQIAIGFSGHAFEFF